jgi:hypothetical protein
MPSRCGCAGERIRPTVCETNQIYAGLGTFWETDRIAVKPYAAMGLLHAAIDAALLLRAEDQVPAHQIERPPHSAPSAEAAKSAIDGCRPGEKCWRYSRMPAYSTPTNCR